MLTRHWGIKVSKFEYTYKVLKKSKRFYYKVSMLMTSQRQRRQRMWTKTQPDLYERFRYMLHTSWTINGKITEGSLKFLPDSSTVSETIVLKLFTSAYRKKFTALQRYCSLSTSFVCDKETYGSSWFIDRPANIRVNLFSAYCSAHTHTHKLFIRHTSN